MAMAVFLVIAAILNAAGLLLMLGNTCLSQTRLLRDTPPAGWLAGTVPIAVGGALFFVGVVVATVELIRRFR
jgi:hypothetical protein